MPNSSTDLQLLLKQFIEGADTSLSAANRLEVLLDDLFPDDPHVQDVVGALAQYRPGGGEYLYDTPEMQRLLARAAAHLDQLFAARRANRG